MKCSLRNSCIESSEKRTENSCKHDADMAAVARRLFRSCARDSLIPPRPHILIAQPMASPKQDRQYSSTLNSRDRRATTSHSSTPQSRLSLISRHLQDANTLQLNTPYSTQRQSVSEEDCDAPLPQQKQDQQPKQSSATMSSQKEHPTVLIPGPIEYSDQVLDAMGTFR